MKEKISQGEIIRLAQNDSGEMLRTALLFRYCKTDLTQPKQSSNGHGLALAGGFVLGSEAPRADVDFSFPSFHHNRSSVDIRQPAPQRMSFGVAYVMPGLGFLTTNFALHKNFSIC